MARSSEKNLWIALGLTSTFALVELVGGYLSGSLALISDAAHMFTDVASLVIALIAIQISKRSADIKRTFGYYRFEIFAAVINAVILMLVAVYILYEAYQRLFVPHDIQSSAMIVIAFFGLIVNIIGVLLLRSGAKASLNVRGAYLEAWADMLGSLAVILAALVIHYTGLKTADSIAAIAIGCWVLPRTWSILKESINILLEGVPEGIKLFEIQETLGKIHGVIDVHDLHIWAVTSHKISLTVHLVINPQVEKPQVILEEAKLILVERFLIHHSTIQLETDHCGHDDLEPEKCRK